MNIQRWHVACLGVCCVNFNLNDQPIMNTFAPEFAQYWLPGAKRTATTGAQPARRDEDKCAQDAALEQLEHCVTAARSVV